MKILLIGSGGREHALAAALTRSPRCEQLFVAPGNPGMAKIATCVVMDVSDHRGVVNFCRMTGIRFVVVGPEAPLVAGLADDLAAAGIAVFGPSRAAARLEGSKAFTKAFLARHGIPTAAYRNFTAATFDRHWLYAQRAPIVVKASGLAAGKGVIIAQTLAEAEQAVLSMFDGRFGDSGAEVVVEEFLEGEEASFIVMCDGQHVLPMASSHDHKRIGDGDTGPNTGGMGAYSPAPVVTPQVHARVMREVIGPTVAGLAADGMPFVGFLYAGLMIDGSGAPKVIEYNVRFGDPETQPILMRLDSDLTELCEAALAGRLDEVTADWNPQAALGVVMAAGGYPDEVRKGDAIDGFAAAAALPGKVFHAGTKQVDGQIVTSGGRVLCAVGLGDSVAAAQAQAYALVDCIRYTGAQARRDIGHRAVARESALD
jgi:phosphoribosylamine--glycine ligase